MEFLFCFFFVCLFCFFTVLCDWFKGKFVIFLVDFDRLLPTE